MFEIIDLLFCSIYSHIFDLFVFSIYFLKPHYYIYNIET